MSEKMRDIDALAGERWFPLETSIVDDMKNLWGDWGVCSEVDTLRDVIMRRPGKEIENFDWEACLLYTSMPWTTSTPPRWKP